MNVRVVRHHRPLLVLASLVATLLVSVQPAAAFSVLSSTGLTGPYSLADAATPSGHQSVICYYRTATSKLDRIEVRHPQVKGRNRTVGRDHQWDGWQFIVQHQTPSGTTWQTIYASSFAKANAADNLAAAFTNRTWVGPSDPTGKYRVLVVIRWYAPGSTSAIEGQVKLGDSYYESKWNGFAIISPDFCLQDY